MSASTIYISAIMTTSINGDPVALKMNGFKEISLSGDLEQASKELNKPENHAYLSEQLRAEFARQFPEADKNPHATIQYFAHSQSEAASFAADNYRQDIIARWN